MLSVAITVLVSDGASLAQVVVPLNLPTLISVVIIIGGIAALACYRTKPAYSDYDVWITPTGKKYHANAKCAQSENAWKVSPCSKCMAAVALKRL